MKLNKQSSNIITDFQQQSKTVKSSNNNDYIKDVKDIRVRFAPSPTGFMHLGNVRSALMNYLFAKKFKGKFILRIEDTDESRNTALSMTQITEDLAWLKLTYDEGPGIGGPYAPYLQSKRSASHQQMLFVLEQKKAVYRCFCTQEALAQKKEQQIANKLSPRYDKTCVKLSESQIQQQLDAKAPFIWRFRIDQDQSFEVFDLSKKHITYDMNQFGDLALTRSDGTFTFIYTNFVDDVNMRISHVIRGEDHVTNTGYQAALYNALGRAPPVFWHLPIICNKEGHKLSKRDFGFSLKDLQVAGYESEAILNYLGLIGTGGIQTQDGNNASGEIMDLQQLVSSFDAEKIPNAALIKYDEDKLGWVNFMHIQKMPPEEFYRHTLPYLHGLNTSDEKVKNFVVLLQSKVRKVNEITEQVKFLYQPPIFDKAFFESKFPVSHQALLNVFRNGLKEMEQRNDSLAAENFIAKIKQIAKEQNIPQQDLFMSTRYLLTGDTSGVAIKDILIVLPIQEAYLRIKSILNSF